MSLQAQIVQTLALSKGNAFDPPHKVGWSTELGTTVEVDLTIVDSLGCAFHELRVSTPAFQNEPFDRLRGWAEKLSRQVTYLLERLAPLESDQEAQEVLIRSVPPCRKPDETTYYEMVVKAPGILCLQRYARIAGSTERSRRDLQMTHEVLIRLVDDLVTAAAIGQVSKSGR